MKRVLLILVTAMLCAGTAGAQTEAVGVFTDATGTDCNLLDQSIALCRYAVVHTNTPGATGVQFKVDVTGHAGTPFPDEPIFQVTIGTAASGVSIGYGACLGGTIHALTIQFFCTGTTPFCTPMTVEGHPTATPPGLLAVNCSSNFRSIDGMTSVINSDGNCFCTLGVPSVENPSPPDQATDVSVNTLLSWDAFDPQDDPLLFDVYFGMSSPPPLLVSNISETMFDPGTMNPFTTYYWKVVARDTSGNQTAGPIWSFTTALPGSQQLVVSSVSNYCGLVPSDTVEVDVTINDTPIPIDAAGIDVTYDPSLLTLISCEKGELTADWEYFNCADLGTSVRIGGFDVTPIPKASIGTFARLTFLSDPCSADSAMTVDLCPINPTDDFLSLALVCGEYFVDAFENDGDVNDNGSVTPGDALCAFKGFLTFPDPPPVECSPLGWDVRADVDCSGDLTPGDALCIFDHWLDGSCTFCNLTNQATVTVANMPFLNARVSVRDIRFEGDEVLVPVRVSGVPSLRAFGFEVAYPPGELEYLGVDRTALSRDFQQLDGATVATGRARVGGYSIDPADAGALTALVELRFRALAEEPRGTIRIDRFMDNLKGAPVVTRPLRRGRGGEPEIGETTLFESYPNPFNPVTEIRYEVRPGAPARVSLSIYNVEGRLVRRLVDAEQPEGQHQAQWDGKNDAGLAVSSGMYFSVLRVGPETLKKKLMLLK